MRKIFLIISLCIFCCNISLAGVRKNWKVTKNVIEILKGKSIEIAQHIYGTPDKMLPFKSDKTIYIWGSENGKLQNIRTQTISSEKESNSISETSLNYGYNCYIALKTNNEGIIVEGIQVGFEPDRLTPGCYDIFLRSHQFCKAVVKETEKEKNVFIPNCYRNDWSLGKNFDFVIPQKYNNMYYYQEDHDIHNFFND